MIRQFREREEPGKHPRRNISTPECQPDELQEILAGNLDDDDADPADFFDLQDLP